MRCNICFENKNSYYKICSCTSSLVCRECLEGMNEHETFRCPLCRKDLNLLSIFNKRRYCYSISSNFILFAMTLLVECIIPIIFFNNTDNNDTYDNRDHSLNWITRDDKLIPSILLNVFLIKPLNLIIYNYINNVRIYYCITQNKDIITNYMIYNAVFNVIFFPINPKSIGTIYFYAIIFIPNWAMFISGLTIILFINLRYAYKYFSRSNFTSSRIVPLERIHSRVIFTRHPGEMSDNELENEIQQVINHMIEPDDINETEV